MAEVPQPPEVDPATRLARLAEAAGRYEAGDGRWHDETFHAVSHRIRTAKVASKEDVRAGHLEADRPLRLGRVAAALAGHQGARNHRHGAGAAVGGERPVDGAVAAQRSPRQALLPGSPPAATRSHRRCCAGRIPSTWACTTTALIWPCGGSASRCTTDRAGTASTCARRTAPRRTRRRGHEAHLLTGGRGPVRGGRVQTAPGLPVEATPGPPRTPTRLLIRWVSWPRRARRATSS